MRYPLLAIYDSLKPRSDVFLTMHFFSTTTNIIYIYFHDNANNYFFKIYIDILLRKSLVELELEMMAQLNFHHRILIRISGR